jgi:hypothetical protein
MSKEFQRVIICRPVKDGMRPGSQTGYECSICQEALQVSPGGLGTLRQYPGSELLCNECGLLYVHLAESADGIERTEMSPEAESQLALGNKSPLARWIRKRA